VIGDGGDMAIYKVSYVIKEDDHPGGIANLDKRPVVGEILQIGELTLEVIEVIELMPPRGDFHYIHTTCKLHALNQ
jgi:hypothetical protein